MACARTGTTVPATVTVLAVPVRHGPSLPVPGDISAAHGKVRVTGDVPTVPGP
ncbi:hypothetical protein [Streptomyces sp. NPDC048644]|uniref:hypothetical protein n=1 Tax=Streptomyces sp. NPDC048644 TaxID=3365582 RepID=UPI003722D148